MAHFVRTQLDATWTTGNYVPSIADWQSLDAKVFASVNGDNGGTWAPSSPIVINGTNSPLAYVDVSVPTVVDFGGSLTLTSSTQPPIKLAAGTYFPQFVVAGHALSTRSLPTSCLERQATFARWHFRTVENAQYVALQGSNVMAPVAGAVLAKPPGFVLPLRVHDGARLGQVRLTFRVPVSRAAKPYAVPMMRVVRSDASGNIVPLRSFGAGADADGYVPIATPGDGPSWYARGQVQTFTYVCDQNQTIDVSQYTYFAQIVEEQGAPGAVADGQVTLFAMPDARVLSTASGQSLSGAQTIDGVSLAQGDRVFAIGQGNPSLNGIYSVNTAGAWANATDYNPNVNQPNWIVRIAEGATHAGEVWQVGPSVSIAGLGIGGSAASVYTFRRQANGYLSGNVYHAAICDFDSIADMRFQ